MKNLKIQVEHILRLYPETRNSDRLLTIQLWKECYPIYIRDCGNEHIRLDDIMNLPSEDHISRYRRKFQEKGLYLPTDEKVFNRRKLNEKVWKEDMLNS